jgi:integrase
MANTTVGLMRRVKTDAGWKYYPAAYSAKGRVKPNVAIVDGEEVKHEIGHYELRFYRGSKTVVFESLGNATPAAAEDARKKKQKQLSVAKDASEVGVKLAPVDPGRKLLSQELKRFLKDTADNGSLEAADVYRLACDEFLEVIGRQYVDEVVHSDVRKFQVALQKRGMSARTVKNRHTSVKAFLKYLRYDFLTDDADGKPFPKTPRYDEELPEIYTDQELSDLFSRVTSVKENLLYAVLLETGLREREAMPLEWSDINWEMNTLKIQSKIKWEMAPPESQSKIKPGSKVKPGSKIKRGSKIKLWESRIKTWEQREQGLSDALLVRLKAYRQAHEAESTLIFGKRNRDGKVLLDGHMLRTLKQQVRAAGLNCGVCEGCLLENPKRSRECERWYLHKFRATYATKLLREHVNSQTGAIVAGFDVRTVQKMMGHKELASTMRYVRPAENIQIQERLNTMKWY